MESFKVTLDKINKRYGSRIILEDLSLSIKEGTFYSIMGPSGCGKSTLMNIIGLLDQFDGDYFINERRVKKRDYPEIRNQHIGFVFQLYYLLPNLTVQDNILQPLMYARRKDIQKAQTTYDELICNLGIGNLLNQKVDLLSGGEKQRVAIARAMILQPQLLLADEPTGALDAGNANDVIRCFRDYVSKGNSVVMVTHSEEIGNAADCRFILKERKLHEV